MRRRDFIKAIAGSAAAWPLTSRAEQREPTRQVGVLMGTPNDAAGQARFKAFRGDLQRLGWFEGKNVHFELRWTNGTFDLGQKYAAELVARRPDVIMCGSTPTLIALRKETRTVPIVFVMVSDPVGMGHVASLARPGGNVTGFTPFDPLLGGKWVELLKEIEPRLMRVALLYNPETAANASSFVPSANAAGKALQVSVLSMPVLTGPEIERAIAAFEQPGGGLVVLPDPYTFARRKQIVAAAIPHHLPVISGFRDFTIEGAVMSYGVDVVGEYRRAANYVNRILGGEKPADLPVQFPTEYQFVINLKTAKTLGIVVLPSLLARADEVIE